MPCPLNRPVQSTCLSHGGSGGGSPADARFLVPPSAPHGCARCVRFTFAVAGRGGRSVCASGSYKAHQVIHGAVHQVHEVVHKSLRASHSAIQHAVHGSLNRKHYGSNELPYDRVLQGAAHQAAQGFVICSMTFELPSAAFESPHHRVTHGVTHGAIHMHQAIHGAIPMPIQERRTPYDYPIAQPHESLQYSNSLGDSTCFRLRTR